MMDYVQFLDEIIFYDEDLSESDNDQKIEMILTDNLLLLIMMEVMNEKNQCQI